MSSAVSNTQITQVEYIIKSNNYSITNGYIVNGYIKTNLNPRRMKLYGGGHTISFANMYEINLYTNRQKNGIQYRLDLYFTNDNTTVIYTHFHYNINRPTLIYGKFLNTTMTTHSVSNIIDVKKTITTQLRPYSDYYDEMTGRSDTDLQDFVINYLTTNNIFIDDDTDDDTDDETDEIDRELDEMMRPCA